MKPHPSGHSASWPARFSVGEPTQEPGSFAADRPHVPRAQAIISGLFAEAGVEVDGSRPWDPQVRDPRFYRRVLGGGSLAFGESYMDGWWECAALDELCCRLLRRRLDERLPLRWSDLAVALAGSFEMTVERGARVSIHPLTPTHFARSDGLKYPLDGLFLAPGVRTGTSNEASAESFSVTQAPGDQGVWLLLLERRWLNALVSRLAR